MGFRGFGLSIWVKGNKATKIGLFRKIRPPGTAVAVSDDRWLRWIDGGSYGQILGWPLHDVVWGWLQNPQNGNVLKHNPRSDPDTSRIHVFSRQWDLVPTVEEYTTLLHCSSIQADKAYSRVSNVLTFLKKLMSITGMNTKKRVDVFALSIYGLVIFPKALGHTDDAISDLFYRLDKRVTLVPTILAETFRFLSAYWRAGEGRFIATPRRDNILEEKWMAILQCLQDENIEWRALWIVPDEILYRYGDFDLVPLLGIWGAIGYAPLLVLRQYSQENTQPIEEHLQVIPFKLEIVKQDFGRRSSKLAKQIEKLEEEKMRLGLDVDVQKLKFEKMLESRNEKVKLKARVTKLERSLHQYRSHKSSIELKASLNNIEELNGKIEELEATLQNCELRVELLEMNNEHYKE
ncbi:hypothetical protein Godav_014181 [Gossypium davidsonii]|uniref:DUF7745 domain-containing protein n=1 Tax=Gossypium davidsonii TaxID=34287 RepID=A0A7J8RJW2_GOSDV|nr:hypothetical protein [Gossypium davidsonii]